MISNGIVVVRQPNHNEILSSCNTYFDHTPSEKVDVRLDQSRCGSGAEPQRFS